MSMEISKEKMETINKMCDEHKDLSLIGEKYIIRPFKDWYDFLNEGTELCHAVHYYAVDKYSKGVDFLFTMRKADTPDMPYITLEFDMGGNLLLAKKQYNMRVDGEYELEFIEKFRREILMPYVIEQQKSKTYLGVLENFCKEFGSYITKDWKENHLSIYIHLKEKPLRVVCFGLGKVNWSGECAPEYPFCKSLQALLTEIPKDVEDIKVDFNCGKMCYVNLKL